ncbi:MAG: hypothetical protein ACLR2O_08860 [Coprococcus sp.]
MIRTGETTPYANVILQSWLYFLDISSTSERFQEDEREEIYEQEIIHNRKHIKSMNYKGRRTV